VPTTKICEDSNAKGYQFIMKFPFRIASLGFYIRYADNAFADLLSLSKSSKPIFMGYLNCCNFVLGLLIAVLIAKDVRSDAFSKIQLKKLEAVHRAVEASRTEWRAVPRSGLMFVSHLQERMDWNIQGLTGVEIYNTHADFKDEKKMIESLQSPLWILQAAGMVRKYPQESYSALQDYPSDYLKRWDELEEGRVFVAFDWLADSKGFDFAASDGEKRFEMGSRLELTTNLVLNAQAPLPVHWRLLNKGNVVAESSGRTFGFPVTQAGNYRVEAWLDIAGERMLWILSNPMYITP